MNRSIQEFESLGTEIKNIGAEMALICAKMPLNTSFYRAAKLSTIKNGMHEIAKVYASIGVFTSVLILAENAYKGADKLGIIPEHFTSFFHNSYMNGIHGAVDDATVSKIKEIMDNYTTHGVLGSSDEGRYGGDQGSPQNASRAEKDEYYKIFRRHHPDVKLSDKDFDKYLRKLNSEGCGYVSMVNMIFLHFAGRPEEFEKTFGFPMMDKNGNYNFNYLLVDIYAEMDNYDESGKYNKYNDYDGLFKDGIWFLYDPYKDTTGSGTSPEVRETYIERYMSEHGLHCDNVVNVPVTPQNYQDYINEGKQVTVSYRHGNIYTDPECTNPHYLNGGHSMLITGVTDDGKFIVSSWGEMYYLDPDEVLNDKTGISFQTTEIND